MQVLGLDIGGANTKGAVSGLWETTQAFEIWKAPIRLAEVLQAMVADKEPFDCVAVTMTAELADCFETKAKGVDRILSSVEHAFPDTPTYVWQTGGEFVDVQLAREIPLLVAAANWHALATWVGRVVPHGNGILIDIGTTTTDIIPIQDGKPISQGMTDFERLQHQELVYTGVRRTPVCAVATSVSIANESCPLAAEWFANMADVYLLLGYHTPEPNSTDTPNGRPFTRSAAIDRVARQVCCDRTELTEDEILQICTSLSEQQQLQLSQAIEQVVKRLPQVCDQVLLSGAGAFLAQHVLDQSVQFCSVPQTHLATLFGKRSAEAACALAVSHLANEQISF